jgi:aristolochene synthase
MPGLSASSLEPSFELVPETAHSKKQWTPPPSQWTPLCHPLVDEVSEEVDGYFLEHWPFPNKKAEQVFKSAGFSRVTCLYFPLARNDSIHFACRLLTVLFLIDGNSDVPVSPVSILSLVKSPLRLTIIDLLEDMSFAEGEAYNEKLIPIARGDVLPDREQPLRP